VLKCPGGGCAVVGLFQVTRAVLCSLCTTTLAVIFMILVVMIIKVITHTAVSGAAIVPVRVLCCVGIMYCSQVRTEPVGSSSRLPKEGKLFSI
jgi:hypothetical protein